MALAERLLSSAPQRPPTMTPIPPGIKIGTSAGPAHRENMLYLKQLGVTWVSLARVAGNGHRRRLHQDARAMGSRRLQGLQHRQRRGAERQPAQHAGGHAESSGTRPEDRGIPELHPLPGQSRHSLLHLRPHGQRHLAQRPRGHASRVLRLRDCDLVQPRTAKGNWAGKTYSEPLSHGRVFTKEEIWENYTYFIKKVVPVAEEAGVRIGIHPDDPPQPMLAGVPRCIFSNFEGYKRAIEIANSPNIGVCLCCGSWLEGGKMTGSRAVGDDPRTSERGRSSSRSTSATSARRCRISPRRMIDDGYYDMSKIMRALVEVKFEGIVIPDHIPAVGVVPNPRIPAAGPERRVTEFRPSPGLAYLIGCMQRHAEGGAEHCLTARFHAFAPVHT